jgi:hypothetical protein
MPTWTLVPAYGRDYTARAAVLADWNGGKDFRIASINAGRDDGRYTNKNDLERYAGQTNLTQVNIRFNRLADFVLIDIGPADGPGSYRDSISHCPDCGQKANPFTHVCEVPADAAEHVPPGLRPRG